MDAYFGVKFCSYNIKVLNFEFHDHFCNEKPNNYVISIMNLSLTNLFVRFVLVRYENDLTCN